MFNVNAMCQRNGGFVERQRVEEISGGGRRGNGWGGRQETGREKRTIIGDIVLELD